MSLEFAFDAGGSVSISGKAGNDSAIKVYICDELEYRERMTG